MKSSRQRRAEIKAKRLNKAVKRLKFGNDQPSFSMAPSGAVPANHRALSHNNTYGLLPDYYLDRPFVCRDCGAVSVWSAEQHQWWYEVAKGHIDSRAVCCLSCRKKIRAQKAAQKRHMEEMAARPPHPNEAFFRRRMRRETEARP